MEYLQEITLDLNANTAYTTIAAKQSDNGSRKILVHLTKDNIPYEADPNNQAYFRCRKPDGHAIIDPAEINADGTITVVLTNQALSAAGRAYADVVEYRSTDSATISTASFILIIMAAPDVADAAVSSDEFGYLQEVVNDANTIINEAEAWARGTRGGTPVSEEDPNYENNAKYYSEQAQVAKEGIEDLTVSSTTLETGSPASVTKTINPETGIVNLAFGLPAGVQGAQGGRGTNTVWVGSAAPTDSYYNVWLNPTGNVEPTMVTANQVSYFSEASYSVNTIGKAVQGLNSSIGSAEAAAASASQAAAAASASASQAIASVSALDERVTALETGIIKKIENPVLSSNTGILYAQNNESGATIQWKPQLSYNNDLTNLPQINEITLTGNKSLDELGIAPIPSEGSYYIKSENGIPLADLAQTVQASLLKGDTSVQSIKVNNTDLPKENGVVNLGTVLINKNYLDNPWFTINQRIIGNSYSLSNTIGYICDRWKVITNTNRTVTWQRGQYIHIGTGNQSKIVLCQIIDPDTFNSLKGKYITISVDCTVNSTRSIISWQGTCPSGNTTNPDAMPHVFQEGYRWGGKLVVSDNTLYFQILFDPNDFAGSSDNGITIYKTKIELGAVSTLAQDSKPIEHEELTKCQRYFQQYTLPYAANAKPMILGSGIATATGSNGQIDWVINVANDMVKTPIIRSSVDLSAKRGFETSTSVGVLSSSDLANSTILKGIKNVCVQTKASNLTISVPYFITLPATASDSGATLAYFSLSAEP